MVQLTPLDHGDERERAVHLSLFGEALRRRYELTNQQQDLDDSVDAGRQAVETAPDDPRVGVRLSNLAIALHARYELTKQQQDLDDAINVGRQAVDTTLPDDPLQARYLSHLVASLCARFEVANQQQDLDDAIDAGRQAVLASPPDHPDRATVLSNLGSALRGRYERTRQQEDLDEAIDACRRGARVITAPPTSRLLAARQWGRHAGAAGNLNTAARGYAEAVALLPLAAWHGLDRKTREHHLRKLAGLTGEAATAAVLAGNPTQAVELLESGRSVLWTQALHLRKDLDSLRRHHPGLADSLDKARATLDRSPALGAYCLERPAAAASGHAPAVEKATEQRALDQRRKAARDWDAAVERVRQLEGFEDFLHPVAFTRLRQAAVDGPVVIVNINSPSRPHALIITPGPGDASDPDGGVRVVDLPAATGKSVPTHLIKLLHAQMLAGNLSSEWQLRENSRHDVFDVLEWTWHAIADPVLKALGLTATPTGTVENWPRLWWCPIGLATLLPLHAAGIHPRTSSQYRKMGEAAAIADSVAGRAVSSYTSTLSSLARARIRSAPNHVRQLTVGVPDASSYEPKARPLRAVPAELQVVAAHLTPPGYATHLSGAKATRQTVLAAISAHSWLHLACHGIHDPVDVSRSAFLLHDQRLTIADLAALDLPDADLAYLSACQTATSDVKFLDEAFHLAAALQFVGYRHVLATLWSISDDHAPAMAETIYTYLSRPGGRPDSAFAAHALHYAVTRLRQALPDEPLIWAPFIHLGP
jgi:tetratricopeptide (TPR) repeat protein